MTALRKINGERRKKERETKSTVGERNVVRGARDTFKWRTNDRTQGYELPNLPSDIH